MSAADYHAIARMGRREPRKPRPSEDDDKLITRGAPPWCSVKLSRTLPAIARFVRSSSTNYQDVVISRPSSSTRLREHCESILGALPAACRVER